jgi:sarcosine oxidase subunit gamma
MAEPVRWSPLDAHWPSIRDASWPDCRLERVPDRAQLVLRVAAAGRARVESALGGALPEPNRVTTATLGEVLWLGPDEWLVVGEGARESAIAAALTDAVGADDGAVTVSSAARAPLALVGRASPDVLATCCAIDLDPRVFPPGHCAGTLVAKAPVVIQSIGPAPAFRLFVRPSFVSYVVLWLLDGMAGIRAITASTP